MQCAHGKGSSTLTRTRYTHTRGASLYPYTRTQTHKHTHTIQTNTFHEFKTHRISRYSETGITDRKEDIPENQK